MSTILSRQVLSSTVRRWNNGERAIATEDIYNDLTNQGVVIPPDEMGQIIDDFRETSLIRGIGNVDAEAAAKHGAFTITWVNPSLVGY